ncbi:sulfite exporter TauE/SafE family protein [Entomomonas asaccharolytica]|uniref:Probable membrane transporter protein n=1 Tax=Entomomonas asaccharolytica TaxID=2785331 RepID=A0A974NE36_9GAMM|nr:sulfite exporter TauE/SafE family protein [Entomomonas asaccharolytica]QQP84946.1 sulfite exporter TauE/SafE family protein [Entomomonas asaccharolytica]
MLILIIILIFLLAGMIKGVIGLGLPTIAMGLLTLFFSPVTAAGLLIIPSLVTNIWQLWLGENFWPLFKRLWPMFMGIVIGTLWSILPPLTSSNAWVSAALGIILCLYGLWGIVGKKLPTAIKHEYWLSPLVGYITGTITAATGVFVLPAVPYLQTLHLNKNELVQALGLSFTASTIALAIQLFIQADLPTINYGLSILAVIPALIGMYFGQLLRNIISEQVFRRYFFIGLILLGSYMVIKDLL